MTISCAEPVRGNATCAGAVQLELPHKEDRNMNEPYELEFEMTRNMLHEFLEWRHKVMTRYVVVIGALLAGIRWLYVDHAATVVKVLAFATGAGISVVAFRLDRVNQDVIEICYERGEEVEKQLGIAESARLFRGLREHFVTGKPTRSYRRVLQTVYVTIAVAFCAAAVTAIFWTSPASAVPGR
jgi:hypothetical protein